ncbi:MAG: PQQ-binding-like beta-propeller repeat protein [Deltaproteobacteria bacterium]|nr:PQQ-binding-like beta-propeller repeat protein [Deltaproteobacteria bacterium]
MANDNHTKTKWYRDWMTQPRGQAARSTYWLFWCTVLLILLFAAYELLKSPYIPNPQLLFYRPSSNLETVDRPGNWGTYAQTPAHQRFVGEKVELKGDVLWSYRQSDMADSSPAVAEGIVYVGGNYEVIALNAENGESIWTFPMIGPVSSSPAVAGDFLFFGLLDGRIIALDRLSGQIKWTSTAGNFVNCSPQVVGGLVHIGSADGYLYALDAKSGKVVWKVPIDGDVAYAPAIRDGIIYTASHSNKLYSLGARTGARRLEFVLPRPIIDAPVVTADTVYVVTEDGRLTALKHKARQRPWTRSIHNIWIQLWIMGIPLPPPPLQAGTLWQTAPQGRKARFVSAPAGGGKHLFLGDSRGCFYALDARTGNPVWNIRTGEGITTAPLLTEDGVYFGTQAGTIYGVDRRTGQIHWTFHLAAPLKGDLVYATGRLFARTTDGMLHVIE